MYNQILEVYLLEDSVSLGDYFLPSMLDHELYKVGDHVLLHLVFSSAHVDFCVVGLIFMSFDLSSSFLGKIKRSILNGISASQNCFF